MATATSGPETILDLLRTEHDEIRRALAAVDEATSTQRGRRFTDVRRLLVRHETTERVLVHPATATTPGGPGVAAAVSHEERATERRLARMQRMDPRSAAFRDEFGVLREEVLAHARHEERDEFPRLRDELDDHVLVNLADAARALRLVAPTRPHPRVPVDPMSQLALGPVLGVVDRVRDLAARLVRT